VLPFHQLGRFKWQQLGLEYKLGDVAPPSAEAVERACAVFRTQGLTLTRTDGSLERCSI
jgi:pyruvate formate lyase activating enzyme